MKTVARFMTFGCGYESAGDGLHKEVKSLHFFTFFLQLIFYWLRYYTAFQQVTGFFGFWHRIRLLYK